MILRFQYAVNIMLILCRIICTFNLVFFNRSWPQQGTFLKLLCAVLSRYVFQILLEGIWDGYICHYYRYLISFCIQNMLHFYWKTFIFGTIFGFFLGHNIISRNFSFIKRQIPFLLKGISQFNYFFLYT